MRGNRQYARVFGISALILIAVFICFAFAEAVWPQADGKKKKQEGVMYLDYSHAEDGYMMVKTVKKTTKRLKLRVKFGDNTMTYDLDNSGNFEVFPLQYGSGTYKVTLYKQVNGNKYSEDGVASFKAELKREDASFLCPNQYVNYTEDSPAVKKSFEICEGISGEKEKFDAICKYIKTNGFIYDYIKSVQVKSGTLPDIDGCFKTKRGICQDLSAMAVAMMRVQGIPAKLMVGYADNNYHAWVQVTIDGKDILYDPTAELNAISKVTAYTVERFY